jgi:hypothetical protein
MIGTHKYNGWSMVQENDHFIVLTSEVSNAIVFSGTFGECKKWIDEKVECDEERFWEGRLKDTSVALEHAVAKGDLGAIANIVTELKQLYLEMTTERDLAWQRRQERTKPVMQFPSPTLTQIVELLIDMMWRDDPNRHAAEWDDLPTEKKEECAQQLALDIEGHFLHLGDIYKSCSPSEYQERLRNESPRSEPTEVAESQGLIAADFVEELKKLKPSASPATLLDGDVPRNEPLHQGFGVGYFESQKAVNELFHVYWSELTPQELVTALNDSQLVWDIGGKFLYRKSDHRIVAKTDTRYYGDVLDELIEEKSFFLPDLAKNNHDSVV